MAYRLSWSPTARLDLRAISAFISEDDPQAARKFVRSLFRAVEQLQSFPDSGRIVPEFDDPNIREVIRKPCRIVYRVNRGQHITDIARVWHAARGIPEL